MHPGHTRTGSHRESGHPGNPGMDGNPVSRPWRYASHMTQTSLSADFRILLLLSTSVATSFGNQHPLPEYVWHRRDFLDTVTRNDVVRFENRASRLGAVEEPLDATHLVFLE